MPSSIVSAMRWRRHCANPRSRAASRLCTLDPRLPLIALHTSGNLGLFLGGVVIDVVERHCAFFTADCGNQLYPRSQLGPASGFCTTPHGWQRPRHRAKAAFEQRLTPHYRLPAVGFVHGPVLSAATLENYAEGGLMKHGQRINRVSSRKRSTTSRQPPSSRSPLALRWLA